MAISIEEKPDSRRAGKDLIEESWYVYGTHDAIVARELVRALLPQERDGLFIESPSVLELSTFHTGGAFEASVRWTKRDDTLTRSIQFDGGGGSERIFQAIDHIESYGGPGYGGNPPSNNGALNYNRSTRNVEGAEILAGFSTFTLQMTVPHGQMQAAHIDFLERSQRHTNSLPWTITTDDGVQLTFTEEEVLFAKLSGGKQTAEDWQFTGLFHGRRTKTNFNVGDVSVTEKRGWHHMSVEYKDSEDENVFVKVPDVVHIDRVYPTTDFNEF